MSSGFLLISLCWCLSNILLLWTVYCPNILLLWSVFCYVCSYWLLLSVVLSDVFWAINEESVSLLMFGVGTPLWSSFVLFIFMNFISFCNFFLSWVIFCCQDLVFCGVVLFMVIRIFLTNNDLSYFIFCILSWSSFLLWTLCLLLYVSHVTGLTVQSVYSIIVILVICFSFIIAYFFVVGSWFVVPIIWCCIIFWMALVFRWYVNVFLRAV